jgi:hypothetical protein
LDALGGSRITPRCRDGACAGTIPIMLRLSHLGLAACLAFSLACGNTPSESASNDDDESESGSNGTAESESGSASMTGDGDGDGDGDSGDGDGDSGDGDGDSGDGDGDGDSGDGDGDSGDGDGDSGDGDGDGDSGDGDGDTGGDGDGDTGGDGDGDTGGDGDGDGDPEPEPYYSDCPMAQDSECRMDEYCFFDNFDNWQVCSQNCANVNDCPAVANHSLKCIGLNGNLFQKRCFISCENNEPCPMGMDCQTENLGIDHICVFPQP